MGSDPRSWLVENWWNEAVNVFNFASNNWATFAAQADKVSEAEWKPLYNYCNADNNAKLEGAELTEVKTYVTGMLTSNSWNPSAADIAGVKAAWANAQVDGNDDSASTVELARFLVGTWNVMLQ